jgi:hypothetical protein
MAAHWAVRGQVDTQRYGSTHQACTLTRFWKGEERVAVSGSCLSLLRTQGKEEAEATLIPVEDSASHAIHLSAQLSRRLTFECTRSLPRQLVRNTDTGARPLLLHTGCSCTEQDIARPNMIKNNTREEQSV